jgi:hypothetical protein
MNSKISCSRSALACNFLYGLIVFVVCLVVSAFVLPAQKVTVTNANLMRFDLAANSISSLSYNITFTMSIHNVVWYITNYHDLEVDCYYNTAKFDSLELLGDLRLMPTRTRRFNFSRSGTSVVSLGSSGIDDFRRSNESGYFDLLIRLKGIHTYGDIDDHTHLSYQCKLNLQLITSQNSSIQGNFQPIKCH